MADSTQASELISSPLSTGGAGTFFEQHVGAFLLTSLLVRGIPPILLDCYVVEVSLQNERLGFHTDDFLLLGICADGTERRLLGQVKRSLTVSASNTDFKDAVTDCWRDFIGSKFSALTDRFALVTRRGSTVLLEYFGGLLECARTANDAEEFQTRLTTKGLLHKKSSDYYNEIKKIISEILEREATAVELWPFLRVLYILSLDLGTSTKQHESFAKNLLAHTCVVDDPIAAADSTWNALLREVGDGMGNARSFKYETLSKGLRKQHSPIQHQDHVALGQIEQHSAAILNRICTTLGAKQNIHLSRSALVQQLLDQIRLSKVVIVSGPAGSGKSAIAKDALLSLSINYFTFCFRADEFARAHFDETLRHSNVSVGAETLGAILGTQDRKILLIESIERLLEKSVREAFSDLLTLVREDPTWQIILTCRDYSTAQVKAFLLEAYGFDHAVIEIPGLSDDELNEVSRQCPSLTRPLENPSLRKLLRTPYFLDKAIQMPWPDGIAIPASERAFRKKFWIDIVQGSTTASGMQIDRERAFIEIALRRARALSMYADAADLDATVLQSLKSDSLISVSETSVDLVTPAHDVLEDWAVVHWIENGFLKCEGSLQKFSELIGTHPAVRRSYRKWISELLERDSSSADELFQSLVLDRSLPEQFGDDTLVCFLRSSHATVFLRRHERVLFENNKTLLLRIMHLLRVACVAPPLWLEIWKAQPSIFNAPDSEAWGAVLAIIKSNLDQFDKDTSSLLLGLIEDWSRAIGPNSPYPEGADSVSSIAYSLLEYFSAFGWSDQRKRTLKVIANIPKADPERFELMLRRKTELEERDLAPDEFRQIIFEDLDGMAACRDLPNLVMSTFLESLFTDEEKWTDGEFPEFFDDDFSLDNGRSFGLKRASNLDYFPASAFQGPFIQLLRHHFQDGVNFIISILNESGKAYKGAYASRGNSIHSTELTFPDQDKAVQICDSTLWNLYRGNSPTPSVLQSALMALEHVLLGYAEAGTKGLDRFLVSILRQSESVAVTAVAASVATAYPHQVPETLMVLLSSPECVILDRRRMSQDLTGSLSGLFPNLDTSKQIYFNERKIADSLLHRRNDLEFAVKSLQLGPSAESVAALIDKHLSNLPPLEEQREFEQTWRLALHRMDLRQYTIEPIDFDDPDTNETEKQAQYLVTAKPPADDLQGIVDKSTSEFAELNNILEFKMWGKKVFVGDDSSSFAPDQWKARLEQAKTISFDSPVDQFHAARKGAVSVAAVCIRYHWDKLEKHDQKWCIETVCTEIERDSDNWNRLDQVQREGPEGGRAAAWVLPSLVGKQSTERLQNRVLRCIALSITHAVHELRLYAAWGVGSHLWTADRELAVRCINAIATEATLIEERTTAESTKPYSKRKLPETIEQEITKIVRKKFFDNSVILPDAYRTFDATGGFGAIAFFRIVSIVQKAPSEALAIACFQRLTQIVADWWKSERRRGYGGHIQTESGLLEALGEFLFDVSFADAKSILDPILDTVEDHTDHVHRFIIGLISIEDRLQKPDCFWPLWQLFADRVATASWLENIGGQYPFGRDLVSAMFLGTRWKENTRHWKSLEGHAYRVDDLFTKLPASGLVLNAYCCFLYDVGEKSMPHAFTLIADSLKSGNARNMLNANGDTIFMLEMLLQRHVYGKPVELKNNEKRRESVLYLLDQLIAAGSSAAYRMRDDFVTPLSRIPVSA